ncbi:MAG: VWA domain-containing protein [Anaerolineaceae bacterium]|nr:VWA domain-containing protein [Anaerolineaceae bacterium]
MLRFAHPWLLLLLILLPPLIYFTRRRNQPASLQYSDLNLVRNLPGSWKLSLRWFPDFLNVLVLILLVLGTARPQHGRQIETVHGRGVDIILAVDISGSMAAQDFEPQNRLEAAKQVINDFIEGRSYDRIGLVVFAQDAFSQSPATFDYEVLRRLLGELQLAPDLGLEDGTAIGMGLGQAAQMLQDSQAESKIIILLTDGVNNAGILDPITAAKAAAALDIRIYTIGMGLPGEVPFPVTDAFGRTKIQMIESEIDEEILMQIAEISGGQFFRAQDTQGLAKTYAQIDQMEKSDIEIQVFTRYTELAVWFLLPALLIILLEILLRKTIFRTIP